MATTATTLVGAIGPSDWFVTLAAMTALKAGDNIVVEQESMRVLIPGPGPAIVYRGARGTAGKAHAGGVAANFGGPSDYQPGVGVTSTLRAAVKDLKAAEEAIKEAEEEAKANKVEDVKANKVDEVKAAHR